MEVMKVFMMNINTDVVAVTKHVNQMYGMHAFLVIIALFCYNITITLYAMQNGKTFSVDYTSLSFHSCMEFLT